MGPKCLECHWTNETGVTRCRNCGADLTTQRPPPPRESSRARRDREAAEARAARAQAERPSASTGAAADPGVGHTSGVPNLERAMSEPWYYTVAGTRYGPLTVEHLGQLIASGQLGPDVFVWRPGLAQWVRADSQPEIAGQIPPAAPQPQLTPSPPSAFSAVPPLVQPSYPVGGSSRREQGNLIARAFRPSGRFSRGEFAMLFLGAHAVSFGLWFTVGLGEADRSLQVIALPFALALIPWLLFSIPLTICAGIRRLHDLGNSGWLILLAFLPCVNVVMILFMLLAPGKPLGATQWG